MDTGHRKKVMKQSFLFHVKLQADAARLPDAVPMEPVIPYESPMLRKTRWVGPLLTAGSSTQIGQ